MTAWIFSSEPDVFPWSRVEKEKTVRWDGIRGPLARKNLKTVAVGERIYGYHSTPEKALVCEARVARAAYPDPADADWLALDVSFARWLPRPVPLAVLRSAPVLKSMDFLRIPRLSVAPVSAAQERVLRALIQKEMPRVKHWRQSPGLRGRGPIR
ncbi:MAG: EVE domain-containing protein [Elusimicrobia bacterium]|nr:EVE domain-containing protein [Elusimicrobiota bacterium]